MHGQKWPGPAMHTPEALHEKKPCRRIVIKNRWTAVKRWAACAGPCNTFGQHIVASLRRLGRYVRKGAAGAGINVLSPLGGLFKVLPPSIEKAGMPWPTYGAQRVGRKSSQSDFEQFRPQQPPPGPAATYRGSQRRATDQSPAPGAAQRPDGASALHGSGCLRTSCLSWCHAGSVPPFVHAACCGEAEPPSGRHFCSRRLRRGGAVREPWPSHYACVDVQARGVLHWQFHAPCCEVWELVAQVVRTCQLMCT